MGEVSVFFLTSTQTDRQRIKQLLSSRVQITNIENVQLVEFKTRGLTHRYAFWVLQHLSLIFSRIFFKKYVKIRAKIGNFKLKW